MFKNMKQSYVFKLLCYWKILQISLLRMIFVLIKKKNNCSYKSPLLPDWLLGNRQKFLVHDIVSQKNKVNSFLRTIYLWNSYYPAIIVVSKQLLILNLLY